MLKVIVFGSLNMDLSMECEGIPMLGDSLRGTGFLSTSGGKGGNEAVAAARMGAETYMVGKVGNDHNGRKLTSDLTIHGVSVSNVSVTARAATGVSLVLRSGKDRAVVTDPVPTRRSPTARCVPPSTAWASIATSFSCRWDPACPWCSSRSPAPSATVSTPFCAPR
ncbi:PfkB family carbohydrate kinase [Olsenella sp. HMSC062G07]|uniref:PfkB family carbohydrate kinase n=1 Tax=Olsenella sp. HMSC062G07 TaxID=1739330 RepID=UPI0008AAECF6|nr:PfkB family carbohydrate kinase [Olsenella sp. HMSC062G07]OFK24788.1 hypothetical protein HMPREF2826_06065 [Olsenella sp. HMSC062G07]